MDPVVLLAMVDRCAVPEVPRTIVYAVALAESGGHRFVIRDNTTKTVHRFHGINAALVFMKTYPSHSLDIGLMQVNTRAHRVDPEDISSCRNIRLGSEILFKDLHRAGDSERKALCLYHTGKQSPCGTYIAHLEEYLSERERKSILNFKDEELFKGWKQNKEEKGKKYSTNTNSTVNLHKGREVALPVTETVVDSFMVRVTAK
uniref:Transglycosylase SLT domain-containing protein n=1 Tax=Leptospirillum sp. Group II '5-way CG' TaxID=419541 RepID=B6APA7_9BACT|nr:MAG: Conserved protein of unknown function [Leptospirillum sp. Group II '5-way CG']